MLPSALLKLIQEIKTIDQHCAPSQETATRLALLLKALYDSSVLTSKKTIGPLAQLSIDGLDDETIWEELQTRNKPMLRHFRKVTEHLKKSIATLKEEETVADENLGEEDDEGSDADEEEVVDDGGMVDSEDESDDFDETKEDKHT